jgi:wyosine [tRNA(Phe)-imidazoG37] synthetase (radical SAM superfamily)
MERETFYDPQTIYRVVGDRVAQLRAAGEGLDYLSFVPDGEPTLDANLGREIELLRSLDVDVAVITNSSLIWREDVRADLMRADWVSLKVDAVSEDVWRRVDRPHGRLVLEEILEGMLRFAEAYEGQLVTETMLAAGVNDGAESLRAVADFLARVQPATAYLSIPTRPPAEPWVRVPDERAIARAYQLVSERVAHVECLVGYEGNAFAFTGDAAADLLSITAVHPMRTEAVEKLLARAGADWAVVRDLIAQEKLLEVTYGGHTFYARTLNTR